MYAVNYYPAWSLEHLFLNNRLFRKVNHNQTLTMHVICLRVPSTSTEFDSIYHISGEDKVYPRMLPSDLSDLRLFLFLWISYKGRRPLGEKKNEAQNSERKNNFSRFYSNNVRRRQQTKCVRAYERKYFDSACHVTI